MPEDKRRNYTKMYNVHRLSDMYSIIPEINWNDYFEWMVPDELVHYLDSDPEVIVIEPDFFRDLTKLLQSTEKRILANYVMFYKITNYSKFKYVFHLFIDILALHISLEFSARLFLVKLSHYYILTK